MLTFERVIPGVGVYTPEGHRLEGSADLLATAKIEHSVKHLIVHVHDELLNLTATLARPEFREVENLEIDFRKDYEIKWVLEGFKPYNLQSLTMSSVRGYTVNPWEVECIRSLYLPLANAELDIFGVENDPGIPRYGVVVEDGGGHWFRDMGDTIAIMSLHLPWMSGKLECQHLIVDCDNQFHPGWLEGLTAETITLHNVCGLPMDIFKTIDTFKMRKLRVTSNDSRWRRALGIRMAARGVRFE